jgi:hypothetical protein
MLGYTTFLRGLSLYRLAENINLSLVMNTLEKGRGKT